MPSLRRRAYIDWARGIAVLLMIEAHTVDAWTRPADRASAAFGWARILGGLAAPLFLWLSGVALVFAAAAVSRRTGSRAAGVSAVARRGLEIFVLAFLFRVQAFVLSPGSHPLMLFRVDILNVMGPAIVLAAVMWGLARSGTASAVFFGIAATAIAMATPLVRSSQIVDGLPVLAQWYLRPAGEYTNFTMFPWAGFVLAGAAVGVLLQNIDAGSERRLHAWLGAAGLIVAAFGAYTSTRPSLYADSFFWTSSPTYFALRAGLMTTALSGLFFVEQAIVEARPGLTALARLGRHSLFVYWIHVELVYGYASWLWRGRLPLAATAVAYVLFSLLMYRAVVWWERADRLRRRPEPASTGLAVRPAGTALPPNMA